MFWNVKKRCFELLPTWRGGTCLFNFMVLLDTSGANDFEKQSCKAELLNIKRCSVCVHAHTYICMCVLKNTNIKINVSSKNISL